MRLEHELLHQILSKLDKMDADISTLKAGQQKLEAEITDIKKDTARIPYVGQAVSEVNQEVQQVQAMVKGHKDTVDLLSARSIEQEAKLKIVGLGHCNDA